MTEGGGDVSGVVESGVAVLTLDRPEHLNTFTGSMGRELSDWYERCDADDDIRVVVVTGAGRAFCAGADFSSGGAVFDGPETETAFSSDPFTFHPWQVRKPVIAAINGHAVGIGLTMALQCDLRYVAEKAKLGIVQNRRGVVPDARSHWTLPRLVGHARATEILMTGRMFSGRDAEAWGLANEALAADAVLDRALEVAHDLAVNTAPVSVGVSKRLLWRDPPPTAEEVDRLESALHVHLMGTDDAREGPMAWVEKRDPEWSLSVSRDWPTHLDL